jgi:hypothetical protein
MNMNVSEISLVSAGEANNNSVQFAKFHKLWNCLTGTVAFSAEWHNGTGYMDGACSDPSLMLLESGAYKSTADDGRKIIICVSSSHHVVVLFERYTNGNKITVNKSWYLHSSDNAAIAAIGYAVDDHTNPAWDVEEVVNYIIK